MRAPARVARCAFFRVLCYPELTIRHICLHRPPANSRAAAARASSVMVAPASMRAISSRRASFPRAETCVAALSPRPAKSFTMRKCSPARTATWGHESRRALARGTQGAQAAGLWHRQLRRPHQRRFRQRQALVPNRDRQEPL
jgi:hypothetical protein